MLLGRRLLGAGSCQQQLDSALQLAVGGSSSQMQCCGVVGHQIRQVQLRSLAAATVAAGRAGGTSLCFGGHPPVTKVQLRSLSSSAIASFPSPSPSNNQVLC